jgi:hypothetical protein
MIPENPPFRARWSPSRLRLRLGSLALGGLVTAAASTVSAQTDENPPLPNLLLLVDTSGSMEQQVDGSDVTCNPATPAGVNHKSRWTTLVEVLTGTIDNYSCQKLDRLSTGFSAEYALATGQPPYDARYPIPYHRPLSSGCAPAPGAPLAGNPFVYPASNAVGYHYYSSSTACTFSQSANDGLLDLYDDQVRFGLMTFDTAVDGGRLVGEQMWHQGDPLQSFFAGEARRAHTEPHIVGERSFRKYRVCSAVCCGTGASDPIKPPGDAGHRDGTGRITALDRCLSVFRAHRGKRGRRTHRVREPGGTSSA